MFSFDEAFCLSMSVKPIFPQVVALPLLATHAFHHMTVRPMAVYRCTDSDMGNFLPLHFRNIYSVPTVASKFGRLFETPVPWIWRKQLTVVAHSYKIGTDFDFLSPPPGTLRGNRGSHRIISGRGRVRFWQPFFILFHRTPYSYIFQVTKAVRWLVSTI